MIGETQIFSVALVASTCLPLRTACANATEIETFDGSFKLVSGRYRGLQMSRTDGRQVLTRENQSSNITSCGRQYYSCKC
jgi:hypothetical protein